MPSSRAILIDIAASGADPSKPHAAISATGRLRFVESDVVTPDEVAQVTVPEVATVDPVVLPVQKKERGFPRKKKEIEQMPVETERPLPPQPDEQPQLA